MANGNGEMEIEFLDEGLPTIQREGRESGVWVERLDPVKGRPGTWAKVYGPVNNPHPVVNNLRRGNAAGIDPSEWDFAGRTFPVTDEDGNVKVDEDGEEIRQGFVYAMFLTDEQRAERDAADEDEPTGIAPTVESDEDEAEASLV